MSRTKGIHFKNWEKFIAARGDAGTRERILSRLSDPDRCELQRLIMPNDWLDYAVWWRLLVATDQELGRGDYRLIRSLGAFDARENLAGVYRAFLAMLKPEFLAARTGLIWRRYYDTGTMKTLVSRPGYGELQLTDFPDLPLHHEEEIIGWMVTALTMTNAQKIEVSHPRCMARGEPECRFVLRWRT